MLDKFISRSKTKSQKAFTLVELVMVIAIIGLLATIVITSLASARSRSRDTRRLQDINQIGKALELYFNSCESYPQLPPATTGLVLNGTKALFSGSASCGNNQGTGTNGGIGAAPHAPAPGETIFIDRFSTSPTPPDGIACTAANSQLSNSIWNDYIYYSFGPNDFQIDFCTSGPIGSLPAGHKSLRPEGLK